MTYNTSSTSRSFNIFRSISCFSPAPDSSAAAEPTYEGASAPWGHANAYPANKLLMVILAGGPKRARVPGTSIEFGQRRGQVLQNGTIYVPALSGFSTIVYFHGNGYSAVEAAELLDPVLRRGHGICAVEHSFNADPSQTCSEQTMMRDADAAFLALREHHVRSDDMWFVGHSAGSGPAAYVARQAEHCGFTVGGLILISAYGSVRSAAVGHSSLGYLVTQMFPTYQRVAQLHAPVVQFVTSEDRVIVPKSQQEITDALEARGHSHKIISRPIDHMIFPQMISEAVAELAALQPSDNT